MAATYVVIGASRGLGREVTRALARAGHRVIAGVRDPDGSRLANGSVEARAVELGDLASVQRFAADLVATGGIAGIVCNAGVQHVDRLDRTRDGIEETFGVNHLAHLALVARAFPALAPGARVVFVGSRTHDPRDRGAARFGFRGARYTDARRLAAGDGDPTVDDAQRARDRYATSKLCNLLASFELARRVPASRAGVFAFDPGLMPGTGLARRRGTLQLVGWHTILRAAQPFLRGASTARRSGAALAWLLTDPSFAGATGRYLDYRREAIEPWDGARRSDWADDLYRTSLELAAIDNAELPPELRV